MADPIALFVYGTLMVPQIVARVLGRDIADLHFELALLHDHARHAIKNRDYPALVTTQTHRAICGSAAVDLPPVQGVLVDGLTLSDLRLLDAWEDDEYKRRPVTVRLESGDRTAHAYIWADSCNLLEPELWSFEDFLRDKVAHWTGADPHADLYADVDALKNQLDEANHKQPALANAPAEEEFGFQSYLSKRVSLPAELISITPLSGGITNSVCRARFNVPKADLQRYQLDQSIILKYAPPYIYREGKDSPLSLYRQVVEARALQYLGGTDRPPSAPLLSPEITSGSLVGLPRLVAHDADAHVLHLSDLGNGKTLSDWLTAGPDLDAVRDVSSRLARFLAELYKCTAAPSQKAVQYFSNPHSASNNVMLFLTKLAGQLLDRCHVEDGPILIQRVSTGEPVPDAQQCLAMRDLWSGSVHITPKGRCSLVDWEYFGASDAASELGMLLNNVRSLAWRFNTSKQARSASHLFLTHFIDTWRTRMPPFDPSETRRFLLAWGRESVTSSDFAKEDFDEEGLRASVEAGAACLRAAGDSAGSLCLDALPPADGVYVESFVAGAH